MRRWLFALVLASTLLSVLMPAAAQERLSHGNFKDVSLYRAIGDTRQVVLLLSDAQGPDTVLQAAARALARQGALVAVIDTAALRRTFAAGGASCVFPDGDLDNLSHYLQGYARLPTYRAPLLAGVGEGAALAYAMAALSDAGTFAAAISVGFAPGLALGKPSCDGVGTVLHVVHETGQAQLRPVARVVMPWVLLQGAHDTRFPVGQARAFVEGTAGAALSVQPRLRHDARAASAWLPALLAAAQSLAAHQPRALPPPPQALTGLPLIEVETTAEGRHSDTFAVLLSGDGGWAGLDKDVAAALAAQGIPVVGFDSLRYFWQARTPDGLAADLDRVLRYYAAQWKRPRVMLVGYSQGADVLPFAVNRLPVTTRTQVAQTVLMGLGQRASFEFHVGNWLSSKDDDALPILPEVQRLSSADTLCIYGAGDGDSACQAIAPAHVHAEELPGGHHFGGDYARLAQTILDRMDAH
ncbi:virulence factor family protein [Luteimonas sp. RIT-PG2_3]